MQPTASSASARIIRETLLEYAERGVFRGFDHHPVPGPDAEEPRREDAGSTFRFFWLGPRPFRVDVSPTGGTLTVRKLLPALDRHPAVQADVERLIAERLESSEASLPDHRRIDSEKASVELVPASGPGGEGTVDLVVTIREGHQEYAVRKVLNLIHEIWVRLQDRHQRYLWEELQAPME